MKKKILTIFAICFGIFATESLINEEITSSNSLSQVIEHNGYYYHLYRRGSFGVSDGSDNEIYLSISSDGGNSWDTKEITPDFETKTGRAFIAAMGKRIAIFIQVDTETMAYVSDDNGETLIFDSTLTAVDFDLGNDNCQWYMDGTTVLQSGVTQNVYRKLYISIDSLNTLTSVHLSGSYFMQFSIVDNSFYIPFASGVAVSTDLGVSWDTIPYTFEAPTGVYPGSSSDVVVITDIVEENSEEHLYSYELNLQSQEITEVNSAICPYEFPEVNEHYFMSGDTIYMTDGYSRRNTYVSFDAGVSWEYFAAQQYVTDIAPDGDLIYGTTIDSPDNDDLLLHRFVKEPWGNRPTMKRLEITWNDYGPNMTYWLVDIDFNTRSFGSDDCQIQVAKDNSFSSIVFDTTCDRSSYMVAQLDSSSAWPIESGMTYYVRARVVSENDYKTEWSDVQSVVAGEDSSPIVAREQLSKTGNFKLSGNRLILPSNTRYKVTIYSVNGRQLREIKGVGITVELNSLDLADGIYQIRAIQGTGVFTEQFLVK